MKKGLMGYFNRGGWKGVGGGKLMGIKLGLGEGHHEYYVFWVLQVEKLVKKFYYRHLNSN